MGTIRSTNGGSWAANLLTSVQVSLPMPPRQAWAFIEPTRCALQRLLDGVGDRDDVGIVGIAWNMAYLRSSSLPTSIADQALFDHAGLVLGAMAPDDEAPRPPTEEEREVLCSAVNRYDALLRGCSREQWVDLMHQLVHRHRKGHATV